MRKGLERMQKQLDSKWIISSRYLIYRFTKRGKVRRDYGKYYYPSI